MDASTDVGPLAKKEFLQDLDDIVQCSIRNGAKLIHGGKINKCFYEPTLLIDVKENMRAFSEETFGPVLCVIKIKNLNEAIDLANNSDYGLGGSLWTSDIALAKDVVRKIRVLKSFAKQSRQRLRLCPSARAPGI